VAEWQSRPLDPVYAVVFIDPIPVKIREGQVANRPVYLALGVTVDGTRDFLVPRMPETTAVVGVLASLRNAPGMLQAPDNAPRDANALEVLHRSAVLQVSEDGRTKLDDGWIRAWARASRLGQETRDDLPAQVAARRRAALRALAASGTVSVVTLVVRPMGAVVTGTGAGGIRNVGIDLHGTYGWPVLPGTALKGVAHSFARDETDIPADMIAAVFGTAPSGGDDGGTARAGAVTFLDTLPGPGGVAVDEHVLSPHTRGYRTGGNDDDQDADAGSGPKPPGEYINPVPIPFLVLTGGVFHIHLVGPQPEVGQAAALLKEGLSEIGLGAKTTSGYGYFMTGLVASGPEFLADTGQVIVGVFGEPGDAGPERSVFPVAGQHVRPCRGQLSRGGDLGEGGAEHASVRGIHDFPSLTVGGCQVGSGHVTPKP
jgi:CRISPR/Cas system CMR subunit Cmr6 (Cas7 group RAMP superfamily)